MGRLWPHYPRISREPVRQGLVRRNSTLWRPVWRWCSSTVRKLDTLKDRESQCKFVWEKDREVYVNSTKRASLPTTQAKKDAKWHHEKKNCTATRVSTSATGFRRVNSNPALLPSQGLRRVQGMDEDSLRKEYTRLETRPNNILQAQGDQDSGNSSQNTKKIGLELSRDRGDEAGLTRNASSGSLNDECAPSELVRNNSLKAQSYQNTDEVSLYSEQARLESPQDKELKLDHYQYAGNSLRRKKSIFPKVKDVGNSTLLNERGPVRSSPDNSLRAHRGHRLRLRDLIMPILELEWYTSTYIMLYSRSSGASFAELRNHSRSESDEPRAPSTDIVRPEKKVRKRLQKIKSLYRQINSSNESFVCSKAREVENNEQ
ncbi:hypothetical protein ACSS6W_006601 [Trichoderma asperelloides]